MLVDTLCGMIPRIFLIRILGQPEVRSWICTSESCKARTYIGVNTIKKSDMLRPLIIHCSKKTSISLGVKGQEKECSWCSLGMRWGLEKGVSWERSWPRSKVVVLKTVFKPWREADRDRYPDLTLDCLFLPELAFASASSISSLWFILLPPSRMHFRLKNIFKISPEGCFKTPLQ